MATPMTVERFTVDYYFKRRQLRPRTLEDYQTLFRLLNQFAGRSPILSDLADDFGNQFRDWLATTRSPATVNKYLSYLLAVWRLACKRRIRVALGPKNHPRHRPDVDRLRRARRVPEAWSVDEIGLAIDQAYRLVGTVAGVDRGQFWSTLLLVAYYTGWRITAIMSLKIRNFDPTGRTLSADGSTQKHGAEEIRRIPADLANALSTVAGGRPPHDWLFDWPFDPNRRWKTLRRHLKKEILTPAGLNSKRWLFHKIRAAAATALESAGGNPTEFLGHSSPALYQASYRDPTKLSSPGPDQLLPKPLLRPRVMAS